MPNRPKVSAGGYHLGVAVLALALSAPTIAKPQPDGVQALHRLAAAEVPGALVELQRLVEQPSGSRDPAGLQAMIDHLAARLKELGADVRRQRVPPATGEMLVATLLGQGTSRILLLAHMDTVYPADTGDRWKFHINGQHAIGPGVIDDKGGLVVMLHGLDMLRKLDFRKFGVITVAINTDEEIGSPGSRGLIAALGAQHEYVLSFEPGGRQRLIATSGIATLHMHVEGRAAHAGVSPELGRNALVETADIMRQTSGWSLPDKGFKFNWTMATAGTVHNIIPAHAELTADVRYIDEADVQQLLTRLKTLASRPFVPDTTVSFDLERNRPPMRPTVGARALARMAQDAGAEIGFPVTVLDRPFGGGSDAAYAAVSGHAGVVESFGVGGGDGHSEGKEYMEMDTLEPSLYIFARTIMQLSEGK